MGFLFSKVWNFFSKSKSNFKLIILGIQNSGKTTILYRLYFPNKKRALGLLVNTQPTIGSNVEQVSYNNVKFQAWDLGGQENMRSVWDAYFVNTDGIIFVIDSTDTDHIDETKNEFYKILANEELKYSILLIFANKQDLEDSKEIVELAKIYELDKIKDHEWHIQACSAKTGEGLVAGLEWLSDRITRKKNTKFPNNPYKLNQYKQILELETSRSRSPLGTSQTVPSLTISNSILPETRISEEKTDK